MLDAHGTPPVDLATWKFEVDGLVDHQLQFSLDRVHAAAGGAKSIPTFIASRAGHVWTISGPAYRRARLPNLPASSRKRKFALALAYDNGWTTNVPLEYFLNEDSLFAFLHDGAPIEPEHGGPVRLIIPQLYAWKSAKWVRGVRFLAEDQAGFWEEGGYHMRGNPWAGGDGERFRGGKHPQITQMLMPERGQYHPRQRMG